MFERVILACMHARSERMCGTHTCSQRVYGMMASYCSTLCCYCYSPFFVGHRNIPIFERKGVLRCARCDVFGQMQKHAVTLAENKIDHDSCVSSMRLLSLCSLATEHEEIPYQVLCLCDTGVVDALYFHFRDHLILSVNLTV